MTWRRGLALSAVAAMLLFSLPNGVPGNGAAHAPRDAVEQDQLNPNLASSTGTCGTERWGVKTGADADAHLVDTASIVPTTIATMRSYAAPTSLPATTRIRPQETTVYTIDATLTEYKLETDSDYHMVIKDAAGSTMITELADPACATTSLFEAFITSARNEFDAQLTATTSFKTTSVPVRVRGIGFFDYLHGQTGVAPNGIELHPVLDLFFSPHPNDPTVNSVSPNVGPSVGGTQVIVAGTNFNGVNAVGFGSTAAASYTVNSPTQITAISPPGSGEVDVKVTTSGGTSATSFADHFTFTPPRSVVASVVPSQGPPGGGTSVTVNGSNFVGVSAVRFGSAAAAVTATSSNQITAISPPGSGIVDVTVTTAAGTSATTRADQFTYGREIAPSSPNPVAPRTHVNQAPSATPAPRTAHLSSNRYSVGLDTGTAEEVPPAAINQAQTDEVTRIIRTLLLVINSRWSSSGTG